MAPTEPALKADRTVLIAGFEPAQGQRLGLALEDSGLEWIVESTPDVAFALAAGLDPAPCVLTPADGTHGDRWMTAALRAHAPNALIAALIESPSPQLVGRLLREGVDDFIVTGVDALGESDAIATLAGRIRLLQSGEISHEDVDVISAVGHWIEVEIPACPRRYRWLRRFLDALEEVLPGGERSKFFMALSEMLRPAIEAEEHAPCGARVQLAIYRFHDVRVIRVYAENGLRLGAAHRGAVVADPLRPGAAPGNTAFDLDAGDTASSTGWLGVVAHYADHFITSGAGRQAMLVKYMKGRP